MYIHDMESCPNVNHRGRTFNLETLFRAAATRTGSRNSHTHWVCVPPVLYLHVYTCIYMYIHVFTCIYMYVNVYTWIYMDIHGYTWIYIKIC